VTDPAAVPTVVGVSASEGAAFGNAAVATFTDPGGAEVLTDYSATINWGDGTNSTGTISVSGGVFTVAGSHTYAEEGSYTVSATISHDSAASASATGTATVTDPAVVPNGIASSGSEGAAFSSAAVATFTDPGGVEALTDYAATINWGDGSSSTGTISVSGSVFTVAGSHTYAEEGSYTVSTTISHDSAASRGAERSSLEHQRGNDLRCGRGDVHGPRCSRGFDRLLLHDQLGGRHQFGWLDLPQQWRVHGDRESRLRGRGQLHDQHHRQS